MHSCETLGFANTQGCGYHRIITESNSADCILYTAPVPSFSEYAMHLACILDVASRAQVKRLRAQVKRLVPVQKLADAGA